MWDDYGYYVPRKQSAADAAKARAKLQKENPDIRPVVLTGHKLATSWWALAWNKNLESYADFASRIGRGRAYVRSGAVLDLSVKLGRIDALVQGSRAKPYRVTVTVKPMTDEKWNRIAGIYGGSIRNLEMLVSGKFPVELAEFFTDKKDGLFPSPNEISFDCNCPDWASMCKHVAAVLYGIGARFDTDPLVFFTLRGIPFETLLKKSVDEKMKSMLKNVGNPTSRVMTDVDTKELFGV
jgi:uncharacterized Zn finger protein